MAWSLVQSVPLPVIGGLAIIAAVIIHNISGALFAFLMRRIDAKKGVATTSPLTHEDPSPVATWLQLEL